MQHSWRKPHEENYEVCYRCKMRRRSCVRDKPNKRKSYAAKEYSSDDGKTWRWVAKRMPTPRCEKVEETIQP